MSVRVKDKYKWLDADICLKCSSIMSTPKGNRLRYVICQKCYKELKKQMKHWNKYGLYATKVSPQQERKIK